MQISITITGDRETIAYLSRVGNDLNDMRDTMGEIGTELKSFFSEDVFATQGGAISNKWPSLKPATVRQKSARYRAYSSVPLIRTGTMKNSFYDKVSTNSVEIGNEAPHFVYHQSSAPRTRIPYRPMLAVNDKVKTIVRTVVSDRVEEILSNR